MHRPPRRTLAALAFVGCLVPVLAFADSTYLALPFVQDWSSAALITVDDDWSGVPGVIGYRGDGLTLSVGTDPQTIVTSGGPVDVNANELFTSLTIGGLAEFAIANPVAALQCTNASQAPYLVFYVNTVGLYDIWISCLLRDIDTSIDHAVQPIALQYRTDNVMSWINIPAGFLADASAGPSLSLTTPRSVGLPSAASNQPTLQIRFIAANASGADEWIGVDDVLIRGLPFGEVDSDPGLQAPSVAWGDYDGDNDLDYMLAGYTGTAGEVRLYRNDGGGTFVNGLTLALGTAGGLLARAAWGDYDGDNDVDLLTAYGTTRVWRNNGNNTFNDIGASLPSVTEPSLAWGDYDNDGDQDFVVSGLDGTSTPMSQIRRNNGDGTFDAVGASLIGLSLGAADWGDFDEDGDLDLALVGQASVSPSVRVARVYRNDGGGAFLDIEADLPGVNDGSVEWGDYDADGDLDLALGGVSAGTTGVFRNDGGETFNLAADIATSRGNTSWGDYDNDGDLDLLAMGDETPGEVYRNDETGFTDMNTFPVGADAGYASGAWGDYDEDGDLDIVVAADEDEGTRVLELYRNNTQTPNTSPFPPGGRYALGTATGVTFSWNAASDAQTPSAALGYNLRVDPTTGPPGYVNSPMAAPTGYRRVVQAGNVNGNLEWTLELPPGQYYWSVQSIDGAYEGSSFSQDEVVIVGAPFVKADILPSTSARYRSSHWGDYDNDDDLDLLMAGVDTSFIATIFRNEGGTSFSELPSLPLGGSEVPRATWGDYDSDGDLDILAAGGATRVYRNNGSGGFEDTEALLPVLGVGGAAVAWGDYDNDGDLDFVITGADTNFVDIAQVRRNNGDGTFDDIGAGLLGVSNGGVDWGDFDNDEDLDLLVAGSASSRVYRNDGGGAFVDIAAGLHPVSRASADWGDYDADGDLDIVLGGIGDSLHKIWVYRQDGSAFTHLVYPTSLNNSGSTTWGDCDNDGDLDILAVGAHASPRPPHIFRNDAGSTFTFQIELATFPSTLEVKTGTAAWGDYDNDGDLDAIIAGDTGFFVGVFELYRNDFAPPSGPPSSPMGLSATAVPTGLNLSWQEAATSLLPSSGLTYNVRVGTTPGGGDLVSPMSSPGGYRRIAEPGNANTNMEWSLDVPPGSYYWTVQSVGSQFSGSPFASEQSVIVGVVDAPQLLSAPTIFALHAPRPTPFAHKASIAFDVPRPATLSLRVYDVGGRLVRTLASKRFPVGRHQVEWDGRNDDTAPAANGVYFLALESREFSAHHRLVLMR